MSPKKLAAIVGGIAVGLLLLMLLFPILKKSLMGEEPLVVGTNPFEGAPPPPVPMVTPVVGVQPAVDVPNAPGTQQTVKDVLTDRKDMLANTNPLSTGSRTGTGTELVAPDSRNLVAPDWMDQPLLTTASPIFSIRKGQTVESERQYPFLQDALKNVSRDGGRLVLFHEGPFELAPTELSGGTVSIEAAAGIRPRIKLVKDSENNKPPGVVVTGGNLLLDGVDIVCDADAAPADIAWTWFHVNGGHIYVKRSSLTLTGQRKGTTTALKLSGKVGGASTSSRFLFDESVVRGEGLQAVQLESPGLDAVIRNSLVISGESGAVTIRLSQKATAESTRKLRIASSTISSRQQALTLCSTDMPTPVPTEILLEETLFAVPEQAPQSIFLRLDDWPSTKPRVGDAGPFRNLVWTSKGSAALGFNTLLSSNVDASVLATDGNAWKQLWKDSSGIVFSSINWPVNIKVPLVQTELKLWSPKTLESLPVVFSGSQIPGCRVSNVRAPDLSASNQVAAEQGQRPRVPPPFTAKLVQQVDLNKTDLGKLISSKTWDDGTVFVANGSGTRQSSPILIEGRKIRIQFMQSEGPPLLINPKAGPRSGEHAAFITVRGGQLDLEQGTFAYDSKDAQSITPWFMNVEGGGFALRGCRIMAPVATTGKSKGLLRWTANQGATSAKSDGGFAAFGQIADSRLVGGGTLVSLELSNMAFVTKNSAFISRQNLFEVVNKPAAGSAASAFDAQECTYLAAGTQFIIPVPTGDAEKSSPIRLFHQDCVFATLQADAAGKTGPLMMNVIGAELPKSAVIWSEESCGYAMELKAFYLASPSVSAGVVASQDFAEQWVKRWGENRIQHYLRTLDGVLFEKNLTNAASQVKPENLALHKSSKARTWSETGGPIGVRPEALEPAPALPRVVPGPKKTTPGGNTTKPGLKL